MIDNIYVFGNFAAKIRIPNVPTDDFDLIQAFNILQPAPIIKGVILRQSSNLEPPSHKHLGQMRADKAICTSD